METVSRRQFLAASGTIAFAAQTALRNGVCACPTEQVTDHETFVPRKMPRVDVHVHINEKHDGQTGKFIEVQSRGQIAVSVNLSGSREMVERADSIREKWKGRILLCPRDTEISDGLWWSNKDLAMFKKQQCAGTKIWAQYHQGVLTKEFESKVRLQGKLGLPAIGFHVADPPEGKFWKPNYWECIREAEKLIQRCPETTFIMAHGFWLMNDDRGLDVLSDYFDRYANLNVDLCAVYQWWDPPNPSHEKLREFIIAYKDRLLFGTDSHPGYTTGERLNRVYRLLESADGELQGFFRDDATLQGLDLPVDALENIYYRNAARLVPGVRESLAAQGHSLQ